MNSIVVHYFLGKSLLVVAIHTKSFRWPGCVMFLLGLHSWASGKVSVSFELLLSCIPYVFCKSLYHNSNITYFGVDHSITLPFSLILTHQPATNLQSQWSFIHMALNIIMFRVHIQPYHYTYFHTHISLNFQYNQSQFHQ